MLLSVSHGALANMQDEITHLLTFVAQTNCTYERNGDMHNGEEAVAHIKKKYEYFADDITTTEDFIAYAATKSKMSGQYYLVHCPSKPAQKSQDWLLDELDHYRAMQDPN